MSVLNNLAESWSDLKYEQKLNIANEYVGLKHINDFVSLMNNYNN
jgi:hypothetical protein